MCEWVCDHVCVISLRGLIKYLQWKSSDVSSLYPDGSSYLSPAPLLPSLSVCASGSQWGGVGENTASINDSGGL